MVPVFKYKFTNSKTEITCNSLLGQSPGVAMVPLGSVHNCCFNVSFSPSFIFFKKRENEKMLVMLHHNVHLSFKVHEKGLPPNGSKCKECEE